MRKKAISAGLLAILIIMFACAFTIDENSSVKELTHPYINTYECTRATLGNTNLLEKYEYFRIILDEGNKLTLLLKRQDDAEKKFISTYAYDDKTHTLTAEAGILGFAYRHETTIEKGKFTISMPIMTRQLVMVFEAL